MEPSVAVLATAYTKTSSASGVTGKAMTGTFERQESSGLSSLADSSPELLESLPK